MIKINKDALERAERLRRVRERLHKIKSQRQFAARLGVDYPRYNNWERGWPIPVEQAVKIKEITPGLTLDYLLDDDERGLTIDILRELQKKDP